MLPEIPQLLQLQERDQRIRSLQRDLKDVPNLQNRAKTQLAGDEAAVETALHGTREIEVKIKNVELDIQTRQNTIKRLQDQQFETRKNDEFQALGHEVQRYQQEVSGLEDKELELMEQLDAAKSRLAEAQKKLSATQGRVNEELQQLDERAKGISDRLAGLKSERTELAAKIPAEALNLYERLMKSKGDAAVVPLEHGICGGCHMKVVTATALQVKAGDTITQCESCARILYLAE